MSVKCYKKSNNVRIELIVQLLTGEENQYVETYQWKHELVSAQEGFGIVDKGHFLM